MCEIKAVNRSVSRDKAFFQVILRRMAVLIHQILTEMVECLSVAQLEITMLAKA